MNVSINELTGKDGKPFEPKNVTSFGVFEQTNKKTEKKESLPRLQWNYEKKSINAIEECYYSKDEE